MKYSFIYENVNMLLGSTKYYFVVIQPFHLQMQQLQYELDKATKESSESKQDASKMQRDWQKKLEDAEKVNSDLCDRIEALNRQHASQTKLWQEAKEDQQTNMIDVKQELAGVTVELMGVRSELEASRSTEAKKDAVIKGLEEKVDAMEMKNAELLKRMEGMVDSKDAEVANHLQSANKVHELLDKLSEAENRNLELRGQKDTLTRRVELLEDSRSSQEKEMVTKVAELEQNLAQRDNEVKVTCEKLALQGKDHETVVQHLQETVKTLEQQKENLEFSLTETVKKLDSANTAEQSSGNDLVHSKAELATVQQKVFETSKDLDRVRKELHASGVQNEELRARIKHTEGVCQERQREIEVLDKQFKESSSLHGDVSEQLRQEKEKTAALENEISNNKVHIKKIDSEKEAVLQQLDSLNHVLTGIDSSSCDTERLQKSSADDGTTEGKGLLIERQMALIVSEKNTALEKVKQVQSENEKIMCELRTLKEMASDKESCAVESAELAERTKAEVANLQQKLESMGKTLESKEKSLQGQSMEMQRLETQLQELASMKEKLELDIVRLRHAIDNKDKERDTLIEDITKLEAARDKLQKDVEAVRKEKEEVEKRAQEQGEVIAQLMVDVEQLKARRLEAEESRDGVQKLLDRERLTTRELEDTIEDLKRLQEDTVTLEQARLSYP